MSASAKKSKSDVESAKSIIESVNGSLCFMPVQERRRFAMEWLSRVNVPPQPKIIALLKDMK